MNARAEIFLSRDVFRTWVEGREERCEWVRGRVAMMVGVSKYHSRILYNLQRALATGIDVDRWDVDVESFGLESGGSIRYPDVVVEPHVVENTRAVSNPVFICEILSPATTKTHLIDKPSEYFEHASLSVYLVLSQDEAIGWVWRRTADGTVEGPVEVTGRDASVAVPAFDLTLGFADLYRGIPDPGATVTTTSAR